MKKIVAFLFIFLWSTFCFGTITYYISSSGNDNNAGTKFSPLLTLKGAYDKLLFIYQGKIVSEPVFIYLSGTVSTALSYNNFSTTEGRFRWDISGTVSNSIVITSQGANTADLVRPVDDIVRSGYMIDLRSVEFVTFENIHFVDVTVGIYINMSDHCTIKRCVFSANQIAGLTGAGMVGITSNLDNGITSDFNLVTYNKFIEMGENTMLSGEPHLYHAIYLGQATYNEISYNTIINPCWAGITGGSHGYMNHNSFLYNVVDMHVYSGNYMNSGVGIELSNLYESPVQYLASTYSDNNVIGNFVSYSEIIVPVDQRSWPYCTRDIAVSDGIIAYNPNVYQNNISYANKNSNRYTIDPYWVYYNPNFVKYRFVSGDFDGDEKKDDIAAIYDKGNQTTEIHVWLKRGRKINTSNFCLPQHYFSVDDQTFEYQGAWWTSSLGGYDASKITGRVVSGDFNCDGKDDIAGLFDIGSGSSTIHVWTSFGTSFVPNGYAGTWWTSSVGGYNATKVTGRIVSGDFNNDGKFDIAALYDYGTGNSAMHTWLSNGTQFTPTTGSENTWWTSSTGGYDATKVTYRFVSGDFDGDGYKDDIASMFDLGGGSTAIHMWLSNGSLFTPTGYANTWWTSTTGGYNANNVTGRMVSGDFDGNGKSDIGVMYDYGSSNSSLHTFLSNGITFIPNGSANTWWTSGANSYDPTKVTGRFLAGDFNNDGKSDVTAMFDYSFNTSFYRTRFHVWESSGNSFGIQNGSLGYPWKDYGTNIGIRQINPNEPEIANVIFDAPFAIFPNPFNQKTNLQIPPLIDLSKTEICIFNLIGEKVATYKPDLYSFEITREGLSDGVYLVLVNVDGINRYSTKVIVIN